MRWFNRGSVGKNTVIINGNVVGGGDNHIPGSGKVAEARRPVADFDRVEILAPVNVEIGDSECDHVVVRADDNLIDLVVVSVSNRTMTISLKPNANFSSRTPMLVVCSCPHLTGVVIDGSADVRARVSASSDFEAEISGSGTMILAGVCKTARFEISGSGDIKAFKLACNSAVTRISGSGEIEVHAGSSLDASIAGSGEIRYRGASPRRANIAGSGVIEQDHGDN